jgi:hypothetical protein
MKRCAYCGNGGIFSKDHVWPKCFHDRLKGRSYAHYSPKSGRVHGGEYVIRDVCRKCNNNKLSKLDDYFCSLYDRYFNDPKGFDEVVVFEYDFDLLARCLLKIAFNTARSAGSESEPLERLAKYILEGGLRPDGVAIIGELVSPTYIGKKEIRPTMYRSILAKLLTPHGSEVLVRVVAVNSFFFHLLVARDIADISSYDRAVREFVERIKGSVTLYPNAHSVTLKSSAQDSLSSMFPMLRAKYSEYRQFFDSKRKR